ncbi:MAG TPA: SHOCT domain-containing protein [Alloiococcus sp.]|nr:SHOCT domain-containing protein [Alloiococcus sp.]
MSHCFNWLNQLGIGSFLLEGLFWIGLAILAVYLIGRWLSSFTYSDYHETPLEILQKEFARGNITEEEYLIRKKHLQ